VFLGTVRDEDDVTGIEYSAYEEMAIAEDRTYAREAACEMADANVILQHRLGLVPLGEASIAIAAAAPHREGSICGVPLCD